MSLGTYVAAEHHVDAGVLEHRPEEQERLGQHDEVPVHEADDPGGLGAVDGREVRLHEGELVREEVR